MNVEYKLHGQIQTIPFVQVYTEITDNNTKLIVHIIPSYLSSQVIKITERGWGIDCN